MQLVPVMSHVPAELRRQLDESRHKSFISRSTWLRQAIALKLLVEGSQVKKEGSKNEESAEK